MMSLATQLPPFHPSPGRARVAAAARLLQEAIDELYREDRAKALEGERARAESDARAKRFTLMAEARNATRELRVEVDRRWFWNFVNEVMDDLHQQANEARRAGEQMRVTQLENRIEALGNELDRIQKQQRPAK
jgi:hypothetical protein